jgi:hypothetical protein
MRRVRACQCGLLMTFNGKRWVCLPCNRERALLWQEANPERRRRNANRHRRSEKGRAASRAYYAANAERLRKHSTAKRAASPERREYERWYYIKANYGLTRLEWEALFRAQGERCACCRSVYPHGERGWHTDHDHTTGRVRGILCGLCNVMLGAARDSTAILAAGARYLESQC